MSHHFSAKLLGEIREYLERCYRKKVKPSDLDDFIQDVLLRLLRSTSYDAAKCGGDPKRFVAGIAHKALCHYYTTLGRQSRVRLIAQEQLAEVDASADVLDDLETDLRKRAFRTQLGRLSVRDRQVIQLVQAGLKRNAAAQQVGASADAVYKLLSRFAEAVREEHRRLEREGGDQ